jgi:putative intracellular protease/amidase
MDINCLLFDKFETLDLFGPVEVFGELEEYTVKYFSMNGGIIHSVHHVPVMTEHVSSIDLSGILLVPGGRATRILVDDPDLSVGLKISRKNPRGA